MDDIRHDIAAAVAAACQGSRRATRSGCSNPRPTRRWGTCVSVLHGARPFRQRAAALPLAQQLAAKVARPACVARVDVKGPYVLSSRTPARSRSPCSPARARKAGLRAERDGQGRGRRHRLLQPQHRRLLGIAHLRSTVIGNGIRRLHEVRLKVVGVNHLGDWGTNFGKLLSAWKKWGSEAALAEKGVEFLKDLLVQFTEAARQEPALQQEARDWFRKLETGDAEAKGLWQHFRDISLAEFTRVYKLLGVDFDSWSGESFYVDKMEGAIAELEAKGLTKQSEGALVVDLSAQGIKEPFLLRKADDASLYGTRDLAALLYRRRTYGAKKLIYVVAADQKLHFKQLFKVAQLLGVDVEPVHVDFGLMRIVNAEGQREKWRRARGRSSRDVRQAAIDRVHEIIADRDWDAEKKERIARSVGIGAVIFNDLSAPARRTSTSTCSRCSISTPRPRRSREKPARTSSTPTPACRARSASTASPSPAT